MRAKMDLRNLVTSLILYERIVTRESLAKEVKVRVEKLIEKAKRKNLPSRRHILANVYQKNAAAKILEVLSERYQDRVGGYVRIIKKGRRKGDNAKLSIVELLSGPPKAPIADKAEVMGSKEKPKAKK